MTTKFDDTSIVAVIRMLASGSDGSYAKYETVLKAVANIHGCTPQTARNYISRHSDIYDVQYGLIRPATTQSEKLKSQQDDIDDFHIWLKLRSDILEECINYLKGIPMSPLIETLLLGISTARQELDGYNDARLRQVVLDMRKLFGFEPKTEM